MNQVIFELVLYEANSAQHSGKYFSSSDTGTGMKMGA
jgi:hypothetical protein